MAWKIKLFLFLVLVLEAFVSSLVRARINDHTELARSKNPNVIQIPITPLTAKLLVFQEYLRPIAFCSALFLSVLIASTVF